MRRYPKIFSTAVCAVLVSGLAIPSWADNLIMKDGSEHRGTFVSGTPSTITLRERGRLVRYSTDNVDAIQFGDPDQTYGNSGNGDSGNGGYGRDSGARVEDRRGPEDRSRDNTVYNSPQTPDVRDTRNRDYQDDRNNRSTANPGPAQRDSRDLRTIPAGTELVVRTNDEINSERAQEGQTFAAQMDQDVMNDAGRVLIARGSDVQLILRRVNSGGTTGTPEIALDVEYVTIDGRSYLVDTSDLQTKGNSGLGQNKRTGEMVGGGALFGTIIGAIAGGGKGAAIGAVAGAAAGGGAVILTKGKTVRVPAETVLRFKLDNPVHLRGR